MGLFDWLKKHKVYCPYCHNEIDTRDGKILYTCSHAGHNEQKIKSSNSKLEDRPNCPMCITDMKDPDNSPIGTRPVDMVVCNAKINSGKGCGHSFPFFLLDDNIAKVYQVSMLGTSGSGKTVYKSRLRDAIKQCTLFGEDDENSYTGGDIVKIQTYKVLPDGTKGNGEVATETVDYIGFKIYPGTKKEKYILLILHDFAGKDVSSKSPNVEKTIEKSDAVFITLDPEKNFQNHLGIGGNYEKDIDIPDVITWVKTIRNKRNKKLKIAYIFTQADKPIVRCALIVCNRAAILRGEKDRNKLLWSDEEGKNPVYSKYVDGNLPDCNSILRDFINTNDPLYDKYITNTATEKSFIVSALGMYDMAEYPDGNIDSDGKLLVLPPKIYRVLDPLWWLIFGDK